MPNDSEPLEGHVTFLIEGECFTFPLPDFTRTVVRGWGPGVPGEFHQERWSDNEILAWGVREVRHQRAMRRWGWLRGLQLVVPTLVEEFDREGEPTGRRRLAAVDVVPRLLRRLIPPGGGMRASHFVEENTYSQVALIDTEGTMMANNMVVGGGAQPTVGLSA